MTQGERVIRKPDRVSKPLPASKTKFWQHADTNISDMEAQKRAECEHYFKRVSGKRIECKNCHIGFFLKGEEKIREGHLFYKDKKII